MLTSEGLEAEQAAELAAVVRKGLTAMPKHLPAYLLYDERGSALFERITSLPEYYLTRVELELLQAHAEDICALAGAPPTVLELGAGTGAKTRTVLGALSRHQALIYYPIDVSGAALAVAAKALRRPGVEVRPLEGRYERWLPWVRELPRPRLVLFIGSSIGNSEPDEAVALLSRVRRSLDLGDALLLGADLPKDPRVLQAAYDDPAGVTAAFNRNLLARLNRTFSGDFDLTAFQHVARWNGRASRMELFLQSIRPQQIHLQRLDLTVPFEAQERLHTENSYKFPRPHQLAMLRTAGFDVEESWEHRAFPYAVHFARAAHT